MKASTGISRSNGCGESVIIFAAADSAALGTREAARLERSIWRRENGIVRDAESCHKE
jgi:hypothetical protein